MGNPVLDELIHSLWSTVVPIAFVCIVAGSLIGLAFKWLERKATRGGCSRRGTPAAGISPVYLGPSDAPHCPSCNGVMVQRTARRGANAGSEFWGCSDYPRCRGTRAIGEIRN